MTCLKGGTSLGCKCLLYRSCSHHKMHSTKEWIDNHLSIFIALAMKCFLKALTYKTCLLAWKGGWPCMAEGVSRPICSLHMVDREPGETEHSPYTSLNSTWLNLVQSNDAMQCIWVKEICIFLSAFKCAHKWLFMENVTWIKN